MTNAPRAIVVFVPLPAAGSQEPLRRAKPTYPGPARSKHPHVPHQAIPCYVPPAGLIEEIKRRGKEVLEATRQARHPTT